MMPSPTQSQAGGPLRTEEALIDGGGSGGSGGGTPTYELVPYASFVDP